MAYFFVGDGRFTPSPTRKNLKIYSIIKDREKAQLVFLFDELAVGLRSVTQ